MPDGKKFEVTIALTVTESKGGEQVPFFDSALNYHDMGPDGVVVVENVMAEAIAKLGEVGIEAVYAMGLGEKLEAAGFGKRKK